MAGHASATTEPLGADAHRSMKVLLLGATGRTGHELLAQAVDRGHELTALARDPAKLAADGERVRIVEGSATDPTAMEEAMRGQTAVICALGPRSPTALVRCDLMRETVAALIPAMASSGCNRVVLLSALGVGHSAPHAPLVQRLAFRTLLRQVGKDKAAAEDRLRRSELDWTVVYPPTLTNGPRTGSYRHGKSLELDGVPKISRADVADFMVSQLTDASYSRAPAVLGA
jgi:putative NADH-flavin reductase